MTQHRLPPGTTPESATSILRIIVIAMSLGLVVATGVFAFVGGQRANTDPQLARVLPIVLGVLAVGSFIGFTVFRKVTLDQWRRRMTETAEVHDESDLVQPFFQLHVLGAALTEAPGLMGAVLYFITGDVLGLIGVGAAVLVLSRFYPRDDAFGRFVHELTGRGPSPG